jgi:preprotein translocase subunit Sec61beta
MDPRVIVYLSRLVAFSQRSGNQNMRRMNEMAVYYEDMDPRFIVYLSRSIANLGLRFPAAFLRL